MKKIITIISIAIITILLFWCKNEKNNNIIPPTKVIPTTCVDEDEWVPIITSISAYTWTLETKLEITGCNFSGFEWEKNAWIENEQGVKGILYWEKWSTSKILKISLEASICQNDTSYSWLQCEDWLNLSPGKYKIYVMPWWKVSNKVDFTIYESNTKSGESTSNILKQLFIEKYPKYSKTLTVRINSETQNHARWSVIFENDTPGWIFLATKINNKWQIVHDWNWQISCELSMYVFPKDMLSDCSEESENNLTYENVINYIDLNITEIINDFSEKKPANGKWFADWYGFISPSDVYVDFEDGHFLYRALLKCNNAQNTISCIVLAIFEKDKDWKVVKWEDSVKDNPIIYKWAKDYEWER